MCVCVCVPRHRDILSSKQTRSFSSHTNCLEGEREGRKIPLRGIHSRSKWKHALFPFPFFTSRQATSCVSVGEFQCYLHANREGVVSITRANYVIVMKAKVITITTSQSNWRMTRRVILNTHCFISVLLIQVNLPLPNSHTLSHRDNNKEVYNTYHILLFEAVGCRQNYLNNRSGDD